ncbi:SEC-C metal-binding domain-containing protein [Saccharothrix carnea]
MQSCFCGSGMKYGVT